MRLAIRRETTMIMPWKLTASLTILIASTSISAAQAVASEVLIVEVATAALPHVMTPETTDKTVPRRFWDDPKIKPPEDLAENAWNFNDPNGVPGFAPMPPAVGSR